MEKQPATPYPVDEMPIEEQAFQYEILSPDNRHTRMSTEEDLQNLYLGKLSDLIETAVGDPDNRVDTLVFLDKSARPLSWMMREFWDEMAPQERDAETGELRTVPMPDIKFANIDRLFWREDPAEEISDGGMREPSDDDIEGLRHIFSRNEQHSLDGKNILLVDEQSESGDTLTVAQNLFRRAFPDATVNGKAWIRHPYDIEPKTGKKIYKIEEIPMWYPLKGYDKLADDERGRGVYSPIPYERRSERFRQSFPESSNQFLSSPPRIRQPLSEKQKAAYSALSAKEAASTDPEETAHLRTEMDNLEFTTRDPKSEQLRAEIKQMHQDFLDGKLNPQIVSERDEIRRVPATEYYTQAREKRQ